MLKKIKYKIANRIEKTWYQHPIQSYLVYGLWFFSLIYKISIQLRRKFYQLGIKSSKPFSVPVIVVGNITVGGTGKTPLIIWLAKFLKAEGFNPGIVSRGYKSVGNEQSQLVTESSDPKMVGGEAILLASKTGCPVAINKNRVEAVSFLLAQYPCDIILSDDGLQHYALKRDIEICLIQGERQLGNQLCLPAGPLREPLSRLNTVDLIVLNQFSDRHFSHPSNLLMQYIPNEFYSIADPKHKVSLSDFVTASHNKKIYAVAGIGYPVGFFELLKNMGLTIIPKPFPDHYCFKPEDFNFIFEVTDSAASAQNSLQHSLIIMTEKDAVKCKSFATNNMWSLSIEVTWKNGGDQQIKKYLKKRLEDFKKFLI